MRVDTNAQRPSSAIFPRHAALLSLEIRLRSVFLRRSERGRRFVNRTCEADSERGRGFANRTCGAGKRLTWHKNLAKSDHFGLCQHAPGVAIRRLQPRIQWPQSVASPPCLFLRRQLPLDSFPLPLVQFTSFHTSYSTILWTRSMRKTVGIVALFQGLATPIWRNP